MDITLSSYSCEPFYVYYTDHWLTELKNQDAHAIILFNVIRSIPSYRNCQINLHLPFKRVNFEELNSICNGFGYHRIARNSPIKCRVESCIASSNKPALFVLEFNIIFMPIIFSILTVIRRLSIHWDCLHISLKIMKIQINNFSMFDFNWQPIRISAEWTVNRPSFLPLSKKRIDYSTGKWLPFPSHTHTDHTLACGSLPVRGFKHHITRIMFSLKANHNGSSNRKIIAAETSLQRIKATSQW